MTTQATHLRISPRLREVSEAADAATKAWTDSVIGSPESQALYAAHCTACRKLAIIVSSALESSDLDAEMAAPKPEPRNDGAPADLVRLCPRCGSGDVRWCNVSVRPYCNECNHWAPVNHGTASDAVVAWNKRLDKQQATE